MKQTKTHSTITLLILLLFLNCLNVQSQDNITHIYTNYGGWWSSGVGALNPQHTDDSSILLAFTVGSTTYSTGINNTLLDAQLGSGNYNNVTEYESFPVEKITTQSGTYIGVPYRWGGIPQLGGGVNAGYSTLPYPLVSYLTDGANGLELGTAVFNISTGFNSEYMINTINTAEIGKATTAPDIIVTQMGEPGASDTFKFVDESGVTVGNEVTVSLGGIAPVGKQIWAFFNPATYQYSNPQPQASGTSGPANNTRDIRLRVFDLEDFGLTSGNPSNPSDISRIKKFVHILGGNSDPAFMGAYNKGAFSFLEADLAVTKTASPATPVSPETSVTFTITASNNGSADATNVKVTDQLPSGYTYTGSSTLTGAYNNTTGIWEIGSLANGVSATLTITATVNTTGNYVNTATIEADQSDPNILDNTATASVTLANPSIALVKTGTYVDTDNNTTVNVGDHINYTFTVKNTGNVTLTGVAVTEKSFSGTGTPKPVPTYQSSTAGSSEGTLQPNEEAVYTATYTLTQADIDAGSVSNQATATGTPPNGSGIADDSGTTNDNDMPTVTNITQTPGILIIKTGSLSGNVITYTFTVKNTGNVTLTGVSVTEKSFSGTGTPKPDPTYQSSTAGSSEGTLQPNEEAVYTATYTLTQADIDAGLVSNQAMAEGTTPNTTVVTDDSGTADSDMPTITIIAQTPSIALLKTGTYVDTNGDGIANVGDHVNYTFTVTNTGNVTVNNITIADTKLGLNALAVDPASIAPGEQGTATSSYELTQADINGRGVTNTATATGKDPNNNDVTDTSGSANDNDDPTVTPLPNLPPVANDDSNTVTEGQPATGNVLTNDTDADGDILTVTEFTVNGTTYPAGTTAIIPNVGTIVINTDGSYTFTPEDGYSGTVPTVTYTVTDGADTDTADLSITIVPLSSVLSFTKTSSLPVKHSNGTFTWQYTITVENKSNTLLDHIYVTDDLYDALLSADTRINYQVTGVTATGTLLANSSFNGNTDIDLLAQRSYLNANSKDSILVDIRVMPNGFTGEIFNQASIRATDVTGDITDLSDDPNLPGAKDPTVTVVHEIDVTIPEGFTPNGDGINDTFVILYPESVRLKVYIFNRWGNVVYQSDDYQNDWDGRGTGNFLGQELPNGTYYHIIELVNINTGNITKINPGYITLRR